MKSIATPKSLQEAFWIKSLLEAYGIDAFIPEDQTVDYTFELREIHVQVHEEDVNGARDVLREANGET